MNNTERFHEENFVAFLKIPAKPKLESDKYKKSKRRYTLTGIRMRRKKRCFNESRRILTG